MSKDINLASPLASPPKRGQQTAVALAYGLICHISFAFGVAAMVVAMFYGMSRSLGTLSTPWSWLANVALLLQFPFSHSLLLTDRGRRIMRRLEPRGTGGSLSTTTFATIAALQLFALFALWSPSGTIWWSAHGSVMKALVVLYGGSWLVLGKAMADAGLALQTGALGWVAVLRGRKVNYPPMPTRGLFRFTRQPIYVAFTLTLWTVPTWTPDQLLVAATLTIYCLVAPRFKEARFRRFYGPEFDAYARTVPYWLPTSRKRAQAVVNT